MRPDKPIKESYETARAALEAEIHGTARVSRRLNDNLVEAIRRIWRQLLFSWALVIILALSFLAVFGYAPTTTTLAHNKHPVQLNSGMRVAPAELLQDYRSHFPVDPENGNLLKLLNQIRNAHYKKDIQLFLGAYSPIFSEIGHKREVTFKSWRRYDYLDMQFHVTGVQQENATTISALVTWNIKTRDRKYNVIETVAKDYNVKFLKESGQWRICETEALDNKGTKNQGDIY